MIPLIEIISEEQTDRERTGLPMRELFYFLFPTDKVFVTPSVFLF